MLDKELIAQARSTNLVEYFSQKGFSLEKVKSNRGTQYKVSGYGGLYVKDNMFYRFSDEKSGNAIECLMEVLNYSFSDAVKELTNSDISHNHTHYSNSFKRESPEVKRELKMPERCANVSRVYAYLLNTRCIEQPLVAELLQKKLLYQDTHGNAIFVHRDKDGNKIGGEVQGTSTNKRFKGIVTGTGISAFEITRGVPKKAYMYESSIDMLSYMQMNKDINNVLFSSMAGLKKEIIFEYAKKGMDIVSMVDNDPAGNNFNKNTRLELFAYNLYEKCKQDDDSIKYEINSIKMNSDNPNESIKYAKFSYGNGMTQYYLADADIIDKFLEGIRNNITDNRPPVQVFVLNDSPENVETNKTLKDKGIAFIQDNYSKFSIGNQSLEANGVKDWNDLLKKNLSLTVAAQIQQKKPHKESSL